MSESPLLLVDRIVQMPLQVFVGDRFELIVDYSLPFVDSYQENLEDISVDVLQDSFSAWTIDAIRKKEVPGSGTLYISMRSWKPGLHHLPPIPMGEMELAGISFQVSSILEQSSYGLSGRTPSPPASALLPPGTGLFVFASFSIFFLSLAGTVLIRTKVLPLYSRFRKSLPRRRLLRELSRILHSSKKWAATTRLEIYSKALKRWLSLLAQRALHTYTVSELSGLGVVDPELFSPSLLSPQIALLSCYDEYRFSPPPPVAGGCTDEEKERALLGASFEACLFADALLVSREKKSLDSLRTERRSFFKKRRTK